jgi:hypothetical protein
MASVNAPTKLAQMNALVGSPVPEGTQEPVSRSRGICNEHCIERSHQ